MSEHDPFDGQYDDGQPAASNTATSPAEQAQVVPADETQRETYSHGQLEEMRKPDLQRIANERGLDTSGTRDDLIDRIEADQG